MAMDAINKIIVDHLGLAAVVLFVLHHALLMLKEFLARDSAAKLADNDPSNDRAARLEQAGAVMLDKIPDPMSLVSKK